MSQGEYKNKCDECGKKEFLIARIFWQMIDNKFKWLCKECWDKNNEKIFEKRKKYNNEDN